MQLSRFIDNRPYSPIIRCSFFENMTANRISIAYFRKMSSIATVFENKNIAFHKQPVFQMEDSAMKIQVCVF